MIRPIAILLILWIPQQAFSFCIIQGSEDTESTAMALETDYRSALVQSENDLHENLELITGQLMAFMPKQDVSLFLSSLTFNENGLTGLSL